METIQKEFKGLGMSVFAWLYTCDCSWERCGLHGILIHEPLKVDLPENVRPYIYSGGLQFYDETGNKELIKLRAGHDYHEMNEHFPLLVLLDDGSWYEITGGGVRWKYGKWVLEHVGYRNTRAAIMMNKGFKAYRNHLEPTPLWPQISYTVRLIFKRVWVFIRRNPWIKN